MVMSMGDALQPLEHVVCIVRANTGGSLGATISERAVRTSACANGHLDREEYEDALSDALENDDLAQIGDRLCLGTIDALRGVAREEAESDDPSQEVIATCNRWIAQLRDDDPARETMAVQEGSA